MVHHLGHRCFHFFTYFCCDGYAESAVMFLCVCVGGGGAKRHTGEQHLGGVKWELS